MGSVFGPLGLRISTSGVNLNKFARQNLLDNGCRTAIKLRQIDPSYKFGAARMGVHGAILSGAPARLRGSEEY
jgi:hypothetical protein